MVFIVAILIAVAALGWTILVRSQDIPEAPPVSPTQHLDERKAQIYENLRDLTFEYRVGKLSDEDYQKTKQEMQRELAKVLAEIDALTPAAPAPAPLPQKSKKQVVAETASDQCPHCNTKFAEPMRFCGSCGKAMVV